MDADENAQHVATSFEVELKEISTKSSNQVMSIGYTGHLAFEEMWGSRYATVINNYQ